MFEGPKILQIQRPSMGFSRGTSQQFFYVWAVLVKVVDNFVVIYSLIAVSRTPV